MVDSTGGGANGGANGAPGPEAERLLKLVMGDPREAQVRARSLLSDARRRGSVTDQVVAQRALGMAARELQDNASAARHLRRSIALAERYGLPDRAAEGRMSLAVVIEEAGRPAAAIREIDRAVAVLSGLPAARARMQRAIILRRLGREDEALHQYSAALSTLRRADDRLWQARLLTNRGVLHALRGALRPAERDLLAAQRLYRELELPAAVAQVQHNLGFVAARGGDVPAALTWYDRADRLFVHNGRPAIALVDRAELLLAARLFPEARTAAQAAVLRCGSARLNSLLPQARLLEAQAALGAGFPQAAHTVAQLAARAFHRQQRPDWAALAAFVAFTARSASSARMTASRLAQLRSIADALGAAGWTDAALEARLRAVDAAAGMRDALYRDAIRDLSGAVAAALRGGRRPTARLRIRLCYARAIILYSAGDTAAAMRALRSGLRLVDQYRAALGATELRVHSSAEGADLAAMGLRWALRDGRARAVLGWVEHWRAATLRLAPVVPPRTQDSALARDLAVLRRVGAELAAGPDPQRRQRLLRQQRELEDTVRRRTWRSTSDGGLESGGGSVGRILGALGPRALLELVEVDGRLTAIVAADGRVRLGQLGAVMSTVTAETEALRFALHRLCSRRGDPRSRDAALLAARHAAAELDRLLLEPVRDWIGARPLVVVPTGALHVLPWPALPSLAGRAVTVAPTATELTPRSSTVDGRAVLVAPADPPHAVPEVNAIADNLHAPCRLIGAGARVPAVLDAIDGAGIAHLAAHGVFRSDNPMFSHLMLADGPLTVYDLSRLRQPPQLVVLSACDTALSTVHPGDELMGLVSALLGLGSRALVASVGPVDDEATRELMVGMYRRLRDAAAPAEALAAARFPEPDAGDSAHRWATAVSFVCFGDGGYRAAETPSDLS